jgi:hypothetical protein
VARWEETVESAPKFAAGVRHLDARIHKTIATMRAAGSPRIGHEAVLVGLNEARDRLVIEQR